MYQCVGGWACVGVCMHVCTKCVCAFVLILLYMCTYVCLLNIGMYVHE